MDGKVSDVRIWGVPVIRVGVGVWAVVLASFLELASSSSYSSMAGERRIGDFVLVQVGVGG